MVVVVGEYNSDMQAETKLILARVVERTAAIAIAIATCRTEDVCD